MTITLTIVERSLHNENTPNGVRVLEAVDLLDQPTRQRVGVGIFTHEVMNPVATEDGLDTAMAHMNLIFFPGARLTITLPPTATGGGAQPIPTAARGQAPQNMTLDGSDFFATQPAQGRPAVAPTACIGSVSAVSPFFSAGGPTGVSAVGRQFNRQGNTLTIDWPF